MTIYFTELNFHKRCVVCTFHHWAEHLIIPNKFNFTPLQTFQLFPVAAHPKMAFCCSISWKLLKFSVLCLSWIWPNVSLCYGSGQYITALLMGQEDAALHLSRLSYGIVRTASFTSGLYSREGHEVLASDLKWSQVSGCLWITSSAPHWEFERS